MKSAISRFPLAAFFVMAFLFSWIAVSLLILNHTLPVEPFQILGALAGPTLSAIIVTAVLDGRQGMSVFFKRYLQWRAVGILPAKLSLSYAQAVSRSPVRVLRDRRGVQSHPRGQSRKPLGSVIKTQSL